MTVATGVARGTWIEREGLLISPFFAAEGFVAGFTTPSLGSMGGVRTPAARQAKNREAVAGLLGFPDVVRVSQVHGASVVRLDAASEPWPEADGLWTARPQVLVAVAAADCAPILVADRGGPLGVAHAGWAGTSLGIATVLVQALEGGGGWTTRMIAAIGPSIGPCCYTITEERAATIRARVGAAIADASIRRNAEGRLVFDLWSANAAQLVAARVPRVEVAGVCTRCGGAGLWSSRAADGAHEGTQLGYLGRPA